MGGGRWLRDKGSQLGWGPGQRCAGSSWGQDSMGVGSRQRCSQGLRAGTGLSMGMEQVLVSWRQFRNGGGVGRGALLCRSQNEGAEVGAGVSPAASLRPPAAPACERATRSAAWQPLSPAASCWPHGRRPGTAPRPPAPAETKARGACGRQGSMGRGRGHRSTGGQRGGVPTLAWASSRERRRRSCCLLGPGEAWGAGSSGDTWERTRRSSLRCTYWSWARRSACTASFWGRGGSTVSTPSSPPLAHPHPPRASPSASALSSTAP